MELRTWGGDVPLTLALSPRRGRTSGVPLPLTLSPRRGRTSGVRLTLALSPRRGRTSGVPLTLTLSPRRGRTSGVPLTLAPSPRRGRMSSAGIGFRAKPLQVVIEMRQVNQVQGRMVFVFEPFRGIHNPSRGSIGRALRRLRAGSGSPKCGERKLSEVMLELVSERNGPGINIEDLSAICRVHWARGDRIISGGIHIVPPE